MMAKAHIHPSLWLVALLLLAFPPEQTRAASPLNVSDPAGFFTNVATALLRDQLHLELTNIQVYPHNNYTPAVHRLLQVSANLYEALTNRSSSTATNEPYCPIIYRPLFRRTADNTVVLAGFREVVGTDFVTAVSGPIMLEPDTDMNQLSMVPAWGTPPGPDRLEPMIAGLPVIIGARKGFPNFNEFSEQTCIIVSRLLEFRRSQSSGPVTETNQMFRVQISNSFGVEFWNSYSNPYPRNLQLLGSAFMTAVLADGAGTVLSSNTVPATFSLPIGQTNWPGWHGLSDVAGSFVLPWGTTNSFLFLTNSTYQPGVGLVPLTHTFQAGNTWYQPRWFLTLNTRVLMALVDTDAQRIVDYVNLDLHQQPLDVFGQLVTGGDCSGAPSSLSDLSSYWCTNLSRGVPQGPLNQIGLGLGLSGTLPNPARFSLDPYSGLDAGQAIDAFRYNLMGLQPLYNPGMTFYKSNVFYVPFDPAGGLYIHRSLFANDPLVHYTLGDLGAGPLTYQVDFIAQLPPLANLGVINSRFQPWGGSPLGNVPGSIAPFTLAAKDPLITKPDAWDFPTNQPLQGTWFGGVHRGTPWQTLFLKSADFLQSYSNFSSGIYAWQQWTGNFLQPTNTNGQLYPDAQFTLPTNDWRIAELLTSMFNTNDVRTLASPNQTSGPAFAQLLDDITVLTNPTSGQTVSMLMLSNSPQAQLLSTALLAARAAQPGQVFHAPGDLLSVPELSVASPWLNNSITPPDVAIEAIPSQLLSRLRADSVVSLSASNGQWQLQFSGFDGYPYAVQVASNLVDWTTFATNCYTSNGTFLLTLPPSSAGPQFYRSVLLP